MSSEQGFAGRIRLPSLPDLIQACALAQITGLLRVDYEESSALIYVKDGAVLHAECGDDVGPSVVVRALRWPGGSFAIEDVEDFPARTIHNEWQHLLFEAARQIDEVHGALPEQDASGPAITDAAGLWKELAAADAPEATHRAAATWADDGTLAWLTEPRLASAKSLTTEWVGRISAAGPSRPWAVELVDSDVAAISVWPSDHADALLVVENVHAMRDLRAFRVTSTRLRRILNRERST